MRSVNGRLFFSCLGVHWPGLAPCIFLVLTLGCVTSVLCTPASGGFGRRVRVRLPVWQYDFTGYGDLHLMPAMPHRVWLMCLVVVLTMAPAHAQDAAPVRISPEMVSDALEGQGYSVESVTRTLLGRVRIVASSGQIWREVVLDLSSGQILRDYAVEFAPNDIPRRSSDAMPRGGTVLDDGNLPVIRK